VRFPHDPSRKHTSTSFRSYRAKVGYNADAAYTSHAHGWSTGPTSALTFYVLGLTVITPQGATWAVAPHLSGLTAAEGGFTTPLGWFGVAWALDADTNVLTVNVTTPSGTKGVFTSPVNGTAVIDGAQTIEVEVGTEIAVGGGKHAIVLSS
jgi:hypothetical protein